MKPQAPWNPRTAVPLWALGGVLSYALGLLLAVDGVGVDVPYRDDWGAVLGTVLQVRESGGGWAALLVPHNEHWIPLPKGLFVLFSWPRLDFVRLMILATVFHLGALGVFLAGFLRAPFSQGQSPWTRGLWLLAMALVFSCGVQTLNFFMASQVFWTLGAFGILLALFGLSELRWGLAAVGAGISVLSLPLWLALVPVVGIAAWCHRERLRTDRALALGFACLTAAILVVAGIYVGNLVPPAAGSLGWDALGVVRFTLSCLGSPWTQGHVEPALKFGMLYLGLWLLALRHRRELGAFFVLVATFSLGAALLIALGRYRLGLPYAGGRHYMAMTLPGWAALLALGAVGKRAAALRPAFAALMGLGALGLTLHEFSLEARLRRPRLLDARACLAEGKADRCTGPALEESLGPLPLEQARALMERSERGGIWPQAFREE